MRRRQGEAIRAGTALRQARHARRFEPRLPPAPDCTPELARAWHALQLHWLATVPGYRAEVRTVVAVAARAAERRDVRLDRFLGATR